jgi:hypothetical protein
MIEGRRRLCLTLETFESLAISRQRLGQKLECDKPVQLGVFGLVNHTHPAATQLLEDMENGRPSI